MTDHFNPEGNTRRRGSLRRTRLCRWKSAVVYLNAWEDDIRIRVVASEEGMTGPNAKVGLADVLEAKAMLPMDTPARDTAGKA